MAGDLNGNGTDDLIYIKDGTLHSPAGSTTVKGRVVAYSKGRLPGAKGDTIAFGMGRSRSHRDAPSALYILDQAGLREIPVPKPKQNRITDLHVSKHGVHATLLNSKKQATGYSIQNGELVSSTTSVMGLKQKRLDAKGTVAVGRLYGDSPRSHGGLEIIDPSGAVRKAPTIRGVRSMSIADLNGDSVNDLLVGDSWHYQYGDKAEARLVAFIGPTFHERVELGSIEGSYTINKIFHLEGPPHNRVLAIGSSSASLFRQTDVGWTTESLAKIEPTSQASLWSQKASGALNKQKHWLLLNGNPPTKVSIEP